MRLERNLSCIRCSGLVSPAVFRTKRAMRLRAMMGDSLFISLSFSPSPCKTHPHLSSLSSLRVLSPLFPLGGSFVLPPFALQRENRGMSPSSRAGSRRIRRHPSVRLRRLTSGTTTPAPGPKRTSRWSVRFELNHDTTAVPRSPPLPRPAPRPPAARRPPAAGVRVGGPVEPSQPGRVAEGRQSWGSRSYDPSIDDSS